MAAWWADNSDERTIPGAWIITGGILLADIGKPVSAMMVDTKRVENPGSGNPADTLINGVLSFFQSPDKLAAVGALGLGLILVVWGGSRLV
jgi:hypothetical protein